MSELIIAAVYIVNHSENTITLKERRVMSVADDLVWEGCPVSHSTWAGQLMDAQREEKNWGSLSYDPVPRCACGRCGGASKMWLWWSAADG